MDHPTDTHWRKWLDLAASPTSRSTEARHARNRSAGGEGWSARPTDGGRLLRPERPPPLGREWGASLAPGCHAPDGVPDVIGDQEGTSFVDCHPDRSTACFAVRIEESRDDILGLAVRTPTAERYEDDLVAVEEIPVPTAMFADEGAAPVFLGKAVRRVEGKPQRGHVRAQRIIGNDRLLDQIWTLRLDARVEMLAEIAVGPAVEAAVLHRGHIVGHEVGAEFVAFVDDGPQGAAF